MGQLSPFTRQLEKYWGDQLQFFVGTLETLGQHEFAFGFCGYIGVEISSVRKKVGCGVDPCFSSKPCSSNALVKFRKHRTVAYNELD